MLTYTYILHLILGTFNPQIRRICMTFFDDLDIKESKDVPSFNTDTLYDLSSGEFKKGIDGKWYLTGGLSQHINSIAGPTGVFKSTIANALFMRTMSIYHDTYGIVFDTEHSLDKDKERAYSMAEQLRPDNLEDRIKWIGSSEYTLGNFTELINSICRKREANKKEYIVETPFIDRLTGNALVIWKPFFVFIDSFTELTSSIEDKVLFDEKAKGIDDDNVNTLAMKDANKKTIFLHLMCRLCRKYGIVLLSTGHYGKTMNLNIYDPTPKETIFSKQDWKIKGCGPKYTLLSSTLIKISASLLLDSNKEAMYGGSGNVPAKDLIEVMLFIEKCKMQNAGIMTPLVASQSEGLMIDLTNYHYLRTNDYYGLNGSKQKQQVALLPDVTISRNTVKELAANSYQLSRALEITAQYCYIKNNWNTSTLPFDFSLTPQQVYEKLLGNKAKIKMEDILNSRGYWTYLPHDREYMSLFDILELIQE